MEQTEENIQLFQEGPTTEDDVKNNFFSCLSRKFWKELRKPKKNLVAYSGLYYPADQDSSKVNDN